MAAPIPLRPNMTADDLRQQARRTRNASQARRLLALAEIYDGGSRTDAARIGGVTLQIVRSGGRVLRFNALGPDGLLDRKAPGPASKLNDDQRRALAALVDSGPIPAIHGVVRWRLKDLAQWLFEEHRVSLMWQFVRDNWLSNRIFNSYEEIVDLGCAAWNKLVEQPWIIMSIGLREWAHGF